MKTNGKAGKTSRKTLDKGPKAPSKPLDKVADSGDAAEASVKGAEKPVSLHPLSFAEAVQNLLETNPERERSNGKKRKDSLK